MINKNKKKTVLKSVVKSFLNENFDNDVEKYYKQINKKFNDLTKYFWDSKIYDIINDKKFQNDLNELTYLCINAIKKWENYSTQSNDDGEKFNSDKERRIESINEYAQGFLEGMKKCQEILKELWLLSHYFDSNRHKITSREFNPERGGYYDEFVRWSDDYDEDEY